jgi:hypothetical protein
MDADGLVPDAVRAAGRLDAVYLQPTLHNPLGTTMSPGRRAALADVFAEHDLTAVEDTVYAFLRDGPAPLAALAPERTVLVDSLSKRVAPGLTLGLVVPPAAVQDRVAAALRSGGWTAQAFALEATTRWMAGGVVAEIESAKRADAAVRQELVAERLTGFAVRADPAAYHCWWELPAPWRRSWPRPPGVASRSLRPRPSRWGWPTRRTPCASHSLRHRCRCWPPRSTSSPAWPGEHRGTTGWSERTGVITLVVTVRRAHCAPLPARGPSRAGRHLRPHG